MACRKTLHLSILLNSGREVVSVLVSTCNSVEICELSIT